MVIDTSVLLALVFNEAKAPWCADLLNAHSGNLLMSTVNLAETLILIRNRQGTLFEEIRRELPRYAIEFVPPGVREAEIAAFARLRFPLNLGDCFAYALARTKDLPLCSLDQDFSSTDLPEILIA